MDGVVSEREFVHDGRNYEVKAIADQGGVRVRAYLGKVPANRFTYSVTWETAVDFAMFSVYDVPAVEVLMRQAEDDVRARLT